MKCVYALAIACLAGSAAAGTFSESESNNTLATANDLGNFAAPGGSVIISGTLGAADVDWYSFTLDQTASLAVFASFAMSAGDGAMQLVAAGGDVIAFDDDSGVGLMPALQMTDLAAGTYYVGFSGFGDAGSGSVGSDELFDGAGHEEDFAYKLTVGFSVVPSPASATLLGMGGLVAARRRRA